MMRHMAAIPESTRSSITLRLLDHAEQHWPQLERVEVTYRGAFGYITGVLPDGEQIPLCRLRYGGSAHSFGFAIYSAARDRYQGGGQPHLALHRRVRRSRAVSRAARTASQPLSSLLPSAPQRSRAWARVSQVSTPLPTGVPVSSGTRDRP